MQIQNKIKHFRVLRGYDKQKDFVAELNKAGVVIGRVGLSLWERNKIQPPDAKKGLISEVLRVKPNELFIYE